MCRNNIALSALCPLSRYSLETLGEVDEVTLVSAAIRRAADCVRNDAVILGQIAEAGAVTVGDTTAAGLAALERRARDLIAGNLGATPEGRRIAASYLRSIETWALRHGEPYIVSFAPRPALYVEARVARVRGFEAITRDLTYWQLDEEVLRSDLFAEVGRRIPADVDLPEGALALSRTPAGPIPTRGRSARTANERMG